jgi:hypothetical protein
VITAEWEDAKKWADETRRILITSFLASSIVSRKKNTGKLVGSKEKRELGFMKISHVTYGDKGEILLNRWQKRMILIVPKVSLHCRDKCIL